MHNLLANFISPWDAIIRGFLRKYFPNGKIVKLRNETNHFVNLRKSPSENATKYLNSYLLSGPIMVWSVSAYVKSSMKVFTNLLRPW